MDRIRRRDVLRQATALAAVMAGTRHVASASTQDGPLPAPADTTRFFPGFEPFTVQTTGAVINGVVGGQGPLILLLHGAPQSHISWRLVAPKLAASHTVVVPDLRGYGDSSKPPDGEDHVNCAR
jgi:haloacetate dehalogenase